MREREEMREPFILLGFFCPMSESQCMVHIQENLWRNYNQADKAPTFMPCQMRFVLVGAEPDPTASCQAENQSASFQKSVKQCQALQACNTPYINLNSLGANSAATDRLCCLVSSSLRSHSHSQCSLIILYPQKYGWIYNPDDKHLHAELAIISRTELHESHCLDLTALRRLQSYS